jgi:Family of unknown function (DUF5681)
MSLRNQRGAIRRNRFDFRGTSRKRSRHIPKMSGRSAGTGNFTMAHNPPSNSKNEGKRSVPTPGPEPSADEYKVGPGHPPKEFQFKPGQSGNPKGAKRKPPSVAPDLKLLLERALSTNVKLKQGEKEQIVTKAAAGIEQLVNQFAKGDRHARRDLIALADKLGVDLLSGQRNAIQEAVLLHGP